MRFLSIVILYLFTLLQLEAQTTSLQEKRSFNDVFPGIAPTVRQAAFSNEGYSKSAEKIPRFSLIGGALGSGINTQLIDSVFAKKPGFLVESIKVVPDAEGGYSLLDVYNALGNIRGLKGRLYDSFSRNEKAALFEEATRIESQKKTPLSRILPRLQESPLPKQSTCGLRTRISGIHFTGGILRFSSAVCVTV
jgi:hypothetical protein